MGAEDRNDVPLTSGESGSVSTRGRVRGVPDTERSTWATQPSTGSALRRTLIGFIMRDDGYLRVIPSDGGKACYCKYKFTSGAWGGHYVMTVGNMSLVEELLDMLLGKCEEVDAGVRRPTKDTPAYH